MKVFSDLGVVGSKITCLSCEKGITLRHERQRTADNRQQMRKTLFILLGLLALLSCREDRKDGQLLGSIEQTWQMCEVSLPEAEARAEMLEDSVQKASELVRQRYSLLTIRLRDKRGMIPSSPDRTICLLKIGMKPAQIANVMDAKIQTVWNRVKRAEETCGNLLTTLE